jgi:RNA polymerase sigma-70 factor (ECF subfamily)
MDDILMDTFNPKTPGIDSTEAVPAELSGAEFARLALVEYERPLTRYAAHLMGDRERAREIVQDTFLKLCTQKPSRIRNHLAQWLYTVCRNRALDVRRKESRMTSISDAQLSMQIDCRAEPSVLAEQEEQLNRVLAVLSTLPANQQEVLRLKFQGDLSYDEISRITKLSVGNVGFLIHTGLNTIRERIHDRPSAKAMRRAK